MAGARGPLALTPIRPLPAGEAAPGSTVRVSGVELRAADPSKLYDVGLVGTGPAAIALAAELGRAGAKVCVVGPVQGAWPNNYGVWRDEWEELGLPERCIEETYASPPLVLSGHAASLTPY